MFCPKCGKKLPDGSAFCGGCGTSVGRNGGGISQMGASGQAASGAAADAGQAGTASPSAAGAVAATQQLPPKAGVKPIMIIGVIAAVVAVLAVALVMNLMPKSSASVKDPIDVAKILTCDTDEAYELLSNMRTVSEADFWDPQDPDYSYARENAPLLFTPSSDLVDMLEVQYTVDYSNNHNADSEWEDLSSNDEYVALADKACRKLGYVCQFEPRYGGGYLSRSRFQQDSMPELSEADLFLFIPASAEVDCETIATYIKPFVSCEQCYVVQTDNDRFEGCAKGGGCVADIDACKTEDHNTGSNEYWVVSVDVYSISRDDYGADESSEFDNAYNSVDSASYLDSYVE